MSYSDFINTFTNGINLFINSLITIANSLLSNYIFITILGLSIFTYLFYLLVSIIVSFNFNKKDESSNKYN